MARVLERAFGSYWRSLFAFLAVFFAGLGIATYLLMGRGAVKMLTEQTLHREQVIVRSGAASIQSFLTLLADSISSVGRNELVTFSDLARTKRILAHLVEGYKSTPINGVILVDEKGKVLLNPNIKGEGPISSELLSDRDYFIWSKDAKEGEIFFGSPVVSRLGASKGRMIVPVAAPIIREGKFQGILVASVVIDDLTSQYLDDLRISEKSEVYLIKQDGTIIYSDRFTDPVGKNIIEILKNNTFLGSRLLLDKVDQFLKGKNEGKEIIAYPSLENQTVFSRRLVAYSPINLGRDQYWYLAISTPIKDALVFMAPFYTREILLVILIFLSVSIYISYFARSKGFNEGHDLYHKENQKEKDFPEK